jgi:glycosyltransferase involved in cell wall biosynthesis
MIPGIIMKKKRLSICVVEMMNSGGLIHFDYQLCNAFSALGADVTFLTGTDYELSFLPHSCKVEKIFKLWKGFDSHTLEDASLPRRIFEKIFRNVRRVARGLLVLWAWIRLIHHLSRLRPDVVQFSRLGYDFDFFFIWMLKRRGFVLTQVCHEFEERERKAVFSNVLHKLDILAYNSFSKIFFLAETGRKRFLEIHPSIADGKTSTIPHGNSGWLLDIQSPPGQVGLRDRYEISEGEAVVLFFGLLAPSKGVEDLIQAFSSVLKECDAKLVIAGYPTKFINAVSLKSLVGSLGISDKVVLDLRYIPLNELGALMELATVVVYPYHNSTQSGSLQTAYTFGKPVVATMVGGLPEVVENGKSGYLVPARSPEDLAEKILIIVKDRALADEMGKYARKLSVTRFDWNVIAKKMLDIYRGL